LAEVYAVHELHQQEEESVRLAEVVNADDARVVEPGEHAGLAIEALGECGRCGQGWRQQL
jgi:hypothetical protein